VLVKAWVPNDDGRLYPGLFAQAEAEIARRDDALLVPESALVHGLEGTRVWRLDADSRAEAAPVELGLRQEGLVEIVSGLAPGDRVVTAGVHKVNAGSQVETRERGAPDPLEAPVANTGAEADAS
jgi:membrane fusion protein (multidrug efflux system)